MKEINNLQPSTLMDRSKLVSIERTISTHLINLDLNLFTDGVIAALKKIAKFTSHDQITIFIIDPESDFTSIEWQATTNYPTHIHLTKSDILLNCQDSLRQLKTKNYIQISSLHDFLRSFSSEL